MVGEAATGVVVVEVAVDVVVTAEGDKMVAAVEEVKMLVVVRVLVEVEAAVLGKVPQEGIVEVLRLVVEVAGTPEAEVAEAVVVAAAVVGMQEVAEAGLHRSRTPLSSGLRLLHSYAAALLLTFRQTPRRRT